MIGAQIGQWQKNVAVSREPNTFRNNPNNLTRHAIDTQSLSYCSRHAANARQTRPLRNEATFDAPGTCSLPTKSRPISDGTCKIDE